ncbi:group II intron reverse transcriptase/maturase [Algoriphagus chordae]|uniref:RNA-directed DNA polymerase n=1 Tax=Algoriphagus chordae TaxID=237019 RepID=A0A2W7RIC9_9BACT|nr:group II intron reverse transcriptase/maturase [Algoriphagus chordae]PZX50535.1 group II intron reverse transcriptase/maturase [Algoriphagus chordae]
MKRNLQKIFEEKTWPQKNRTESEGYVGGQTFMRITENNLTENDQVGYGLLEFILSPANLNAAFLQVKRNKGAGGVDKMEVESLKDYLVVHKDELTASILAGKYRPNPVRRVEIPKDNGQKRQLGIPTVVDRVIQQAISQVLTPIYEPQFSEHSYGFRPRRNAHQALQKCKDYITGGYSYAVDLDLEKFFDKVNHSKLIEVIFHTIKDGRVVSLIHKYLNAGVQVGGIVESSERGVPQGGPLSPLLSNILLDELDKELEGRGHKFVRYADDLVIFCKSKRGSARVMRSIIRFIEDKLFLRVNRDKSQVVPIRQVKFLGYSFYKVKGEGRLRVHPKSASKMKAKIKELTSRSNGWSNERRKESMRQYITGWVNYFRLADMQNLLREIDKWYRRRIRMVIWKQWKRTKTKLRNLTRLGISKSKAWEWANTRKGYWHIAKSAILQTTITNENLRRAGYVFFGNYYQKVRLKT